MSEVEDDVTVITNATFDSSSEPVTEDKQEGNIPENSEEGKSIDTRGLLLGFLNAQSDQAAPQSPGVKPSSPPSPPSKTTLASDNKATVEEVAESVPYVCDACAATKQFDMTLGGCIHSPCHCPEGWGGYARWIRQNPVGKSQEDPYPYWPKDVEVQFRSGPQAAETPKPGVMCGIYLAGFIIVLMSSGFLAYWFL